VQLLLLGHVHPELHEHPALGAERLLERDDRRVRALPLLARSELLHALHQHAPVPGAVEHGHPAEPRKRRPEPPQEVVALLPFGRSGVLRDVHVPRVERLDHALQSAALPRRIPSLEDDGQRRAQPPLIAGQLSAQGQSQGREPLLRDLQALLVLLLGQRQRQVELV
jgi:hypothetical protein